MGLTVGLLLFVSTNCKYWDSGTVTDAFRQTATPILMEAKLYQCSQYLQKVRVKVENQVGDGQDRIELNGERWQMRIEH